MLSQSTAHDAVEASYNKENLTIPIFVRLPATKDIFPQLELFSSDRLTKLYIVKIPNNAQKIEPLYKPWKQQVAESLNILPSRIFGLTVPLKDGRLLIQSQEAFQSWAASCPAFKLFFNPRDGVSSYSSYSTCTKRETISIERPQFELLLVPLSAAADTAAVGSTWGKPSSAFSFGKTSILAPPKNAFGAPITPATSIFGSTPVSATSAFGSKAAPATSTFGSTAAPAASTFGSTPAFATSTIGSTPATAPWTFGSAASSATAHVPSNSVPQDKSSEASSFTVKAPLAFRDSVPPAATESTGKAHLPATTVNPASLVAPVSSASANIPTRSSSPATSTTAAHEATRANSSETISLPVVARATASTPSTVSSSNSTGLAFTTIPAATQPPLPSLPLDAHRVIESVNGLVDVFMQLRADRMAGSLRPEQRSTATAEPTAHSQAPVSGVSNLLRQTIAGAPFEILTLVEKLTEALITPTNVNTRTDESGNQEQHQPAPVSAAASVPKRETSGAVAASHTKNTAKKTANEARAPANEASRGRQDAIVGLHEEFTRLREQRAAEAASTSSTTAKETSAPKEDLTDGLPEPMNAELTEAFQKLLGSPLQSAQSDDEMVIVDTVSSTRSNSPVPRSPRSSKGKGKSTLYTSSITLLTLFSIIMTFLIAPSSATALATRDMALDQSFLDSRDIAAKGTVAPRQNSRNLYLCKCTCFQANSTLVPIYSPVDASKPCTTCTRQFCLDQNLDICKDAKLEHTDHDVGTGLEGDVWAKCFERDSYKDQSIITLYLLVVVGLVAFSVLRGRMQGLYHEYQTLGPSAIYNSVRNAPWRR